MSQVAGRCVLFKTVLIAILIGLIPQKAYTKDSTNVTETVVSAIKENKLNITADNSVFGDTAPGIPKKLTVEYRIGDETLSREVSEGGHLEIQASAGQSISIIKAVYGPADGSKLSQLDPSIDPAEVLETLPGFKIEHVLKADRDKNGSWICMAKDPKGRLLLGGQRDQAITRVTLDGGKVIKEELLQIPVTETMGMLFVENVLYLNGAGSDGKYCLFRCRDSKGDDSYDDVESLREWRSGAGEHGAHAIVLGPDKKLYIVCGNFVDVPNDLAPTSPHRNYGDDLALKRAEDGNGFGAGRQPPGGFIARMDLDGKNAELYSAGERNTYDIGFNPDGELFGFDSDMEWDWGNPWYRPVHVFHSVRGGDNGFREGSAKWPEYYPDGLPYASTIGIGCPTGVVFGSGSAFPIKYQKAFYVLDWTYGRLIAVHLTPNGASYTGTHENFVAPKSLHSTAGKTPLNLTDVVIGDDGALYFTIGGRGTQSSLFRVTYTGSEPSSPVVSGDLKEKAGSDARAIRHKLESLNINADPKTVEFAWPYLNHQDRYIRYAARLAIERNPVSEWQAKALAEKQPLAAFTSLLALARLAPPDTQSAIFKSLMSKSFGNLTEEQLLSKLRVIEVSIARQGVPAGDVADQVISELGPLFPAKNDFVNRELSQILLALNTPYAIGRTVALMQAALTQEEQVFYAMQLRNIKAGLNNETGWNNEIRRAYLSWWNTGRSTTHPAQTIKWFEDAGIRFNNGASFANFMSQAHEAAKFTMSPEEILALGDVLTAYEDAQPKKPQLPKGAASRKLVQEWTTADLLPLLDQGSGGRSFSRGQEIYVEAQCAACHRYGDQGGMIGPDLTAVSTRFKRPDIVESVTDPSKVLSEQYRNTAIETVSGKVVIGRVVEETPEKIVLRPNPLEPETVVVKKSEIESRSLSKVSPMPAGLFNTFTKEEILDLLAYLESLGNSSHPNFRK